MDQQEDGHKFRARVIEAINTHDKKVQNNPELMSFKCSINNDQYEDILAYNYILPHLCLDQESKNLWKFKDITAYEGTLCQTDRKYKGSRYNVMIRWKNDEVTSEPLDQFAKYDPISYA